MLLSLRLFFLFLAIILISAACGFKLRGQLQLNQNLGPLYLQMDPEWNILQRCLGRQLKKSGIALIENTVVPISVPSFHQLILDPITKTRTQISDNQISAQEYQLALVAVMQFIPAQRDDAAQSTPNTSLAKNIRVSHRVIQDSNQVNAGVAEENRIYDAMQLDLCSQIIYQLQFLN